MAWGFDPDQMMEDPFFGAYASVNVSLAKLVAPAETIKKLSHLPGVL